MRTLFRVPVDDWLKLKANGMSRKRLWYIYKKRRGLQTLARPTSQAFALPPQL